MRQNRLMEHLEHLEHSFPIGRDPYRSLLWVMGEKCSKCSKCSNREIARTHIEGVSVRLAFAKLDPEIPLAVASLDLEPTLTHGFAECGLAQYELIGAFGILLVTCIQIAASDP